MVNWSNGFHKVTEQWRNIIGYEGVYQISNQGRVKRLKGFGCFSERILKNYPNKQNKYFCVSLCKRGLPQKIRYVHQLVLETFIGPKPLMCEARHLDGNRSNNALDNLEYNTHSVNMKDRIKHGTHFQPKANNCGSNHRLSKLIDRDICLIRQMLISGRNGNLGR